MYCDKSYCFARVQSLCVNKSCTCGGGAGSEPALVSWVQSSTLLLVVVVVVVVPVKSHFAGYDGCNMAEPVLALFYLWWCRFTGSTGYAS